MIWPKRPGSWNYGAKKAREAFKRVAWAIAESEEVFMLAEPDMEENAREMLAGNPGHGIHVIRMESDDAWARDVAPTFVVNGKALSVALTGSSTPGVEPWTDFTPTGRRTILWRKKSVGSLAMTATRPTPSFWKAVRSILTERGRFL